MYTTGTHFLCGLNWQQITTPFPRLRSQPHGKKFMNFSIAEDGTSYNRETTICCALSLPSLSLYSSQISVMSTIPKDISYPSLLWLSECGKGALCSRVSAAPQATAGNSSAIPNNPKPVTSQGETKPINLIGSKPLLAVAYQEAAARRLFSAVDL